MEAKNQYGNLKIKYSRARDIGENFYDGELNSLHFRIESSRAR
jgi:hypothetical protein